MSELRGAVLDCDDCHTRAELLWVRGVGWVCAGCEGAVNPDQRPKYEPGEDENQMELEL